MEKRTFTLGQILSITTGYLLAENQIKDVYEIVDYLTGVQHWTHQLPRACKVCRVEVFKQHPELEKVDTSDYQKEKWKEWLAKQREIFGDSFELTPMPPGEYEAVNPVKEAVEMVGEDKVLLVGIQEEKLQ